MSFNTLAQIGLTTFTVLGFLLTSLKLPEYGVLSFLLSQVFYLYAAYKAWKDANQLGLFVTTVFVTITILIGVVNYWIL